MPVTLRRITKDALVAVRRHPKHDLNLGYRCAIWAALGLSTSKAMNKSGHKRRTILAMLTVKRVLPIWDRAFPNDKTPHRILNKVEQILKGTANVQIAARDVDRYWTFMDNLAYKTDNNKSVMVGYSAVKALTTALWDIQFDFKNVDYNLTDADIDPYDNDAAFAAAIAYANGSIWEPKADASKRQEFWEWWLTEAVSEAWHAVPCGD